MGRSRKKPDKPSAKRPAHRPKATEAPIGQEQLAEIGVLWLQQWPVTRIARRFGVTENAIRGHLMRSILPLWQNTMLRTCEIELARVDLVERIAWEQFEKSHGDETQETVKHALNEKTGDEQLVERVLGKKQRLTGHTAWIAVIQWCVDYRSKVSGYYQSADHASSTVRVAGKSREEIATELNDRIAFVIERLEQRKMLLNVGTGKN